MIHIVKDFLIVDGAEMIVFLEFLCLLCRPMDVDSLFPGSSTFSKPSFYNLPHVLLKPNLKGFDYNFTSMRNECNCLVVWTWAV